ncbi:trans-resveratrol di-O-methyltransferase-like [Amaranthus tricolor]|uniref:trans-resveratrol di-O-methyltransferase-like n=1 Tax=Amaranthus tricolor TaxID=29722 RepID=UPI002584579E|nr:trans-resveratrol di-O-methyltransferase-like [Amaranthus tricolor]
MKYKQMDLPTFTINEDNAKELLEAQRNIWIHTFYYLKSMALKCVLQLGIPDTIHKHGKPMSLNELATSLPIHPNNIPSLNRLMRILESSNFFSKKLLEDGGYGFDLTLSSQLLLKNHPHTQAQFSLTLLEQMVTDPSHHLTSWFQNDAESSFHVLNGMSFWEHMSHDSKFNQCFNEAMECDSRFVTSLLVNNKSFKGIFEGVETLVDVGGGNGTTVKAITEAYPWLKCSVLDLPHVVQGLQEKASSNVKFVAGDMFEAVPHADAVLLKWILHDWSDKDCIKILKLCKEAISNKNKGGKLIIIDIVVDSENDHIISKESNTKYLFDMLMMSLFGDGKERTEQQFKNLFQQAGFSDYKIIPILGLRSIIEVYPSQII